MKIQNTVTLGASVLNNNSASYASYAILLDQAIGHQVLHSKTYKLGLLLCNLQSYRTATQ